MSTCGWFTVCWAKKWIWNWMYILNSVSNMYYQVLYWGNTVVLGRMYRWMRSSFRGIGGQYLLRGEAPKKGIAPQFWGMMTAFTDTSDPELLYSHCWHVNTSTVHKCPLCISWFVGEQYPSSPLRRYCPPIPWNDDCIHRYILPRTTVFPQFVCTSLKA